MKVLMVCLGNICRSPIAEGVLQHLADEVGFDWQVDSAGTNHYHTGEAPHVSSQKVCKENGIDISSQRARRFRAQDFVEYDFIYVMANDVMQDVKKMAGNHFDESKIDFFLNELYAGENRDVTDPWYGTEEGYYKVFEEIKTCCEAIIRKHQQLAT